eukprot:2774080-Pyramimonas_sp.AAC.1
MKETHTLTQTLARAGHPHSARRDVFAHFINHFYRTRLKKAWEREGGDGGWAILGGRGGRGGRELAPSLPAAQVPAAKCGAMCPDGSTLALGSTQGPFSLVLTPLLPLPGRVGGKRLTWKQSPSHLTVYRVQCTYARTIYI